MKLLKEMMLDIVNGFKKMFIGFGICLVSLAIVWGVISGGLTIFGEMDFTWWNVPCWVIDLCAVAGCIGQGSNSPIE